MDGTKSTPDVADAEGQPETVVAGPLLVPEFQNDEVVPVGIQRKYCRKVYLDLVGPTDESVDGYYGAAISRDVDTNIPAAGPLKDKRPETLLQWWLETYPGQASEGHAPYVVFCDHGGEFRGVFRDHIMKHGGIIRRSLPEKPQTNSKEERFHDSLTRCVRASLKFSNIPVKFWSFCLLMVIFHLARTPDNRKDGKTPRSRKTGRDHTETIVPFGCRAVYYDEKSSKFAPKGIEGCVLGYGASGGYVIMDMREYEFSKGGLTLRTTRDCKLFPREFPFRKLAEQYAHHEAWTFAVTGYENIDYRVDHAGKLRCVQCGKLITNEPVTCKACLKGTEHKRGRPNAGCLYARCKGGQECSAAIPENMVFEEITEQVVEPVPVVPPSPRWRLTFKRPTDVVSTPPASRPASPRSGSGSGGGTPTNGRAAAVDSVGDVAPTPPPTEEQTVVGSDPPVIPTIRSIMMSTAKKPSGSGPERPVADIRSAEVRLSEARSSAIEATNLFHSDQMEIARASCARELTMIFRHVTRIVKEDSNEAKENVKAQEAIAREIENIRKKDALFWLETYEEDDAKAQFADAEFVNGLMLLGEKYAEMPELQREWKGRFVILGNNVTDTYGQQIVEDVIQVIPSTMCEARLLFLHRSLTEGGVLLHADGDGAYFTSLLGGKPKFLRMTRHLRSLLHDKFKHFKRPVTRIRVAMYGLKRSGADYGQKLIADVKACGWVKIRDTAPSMWRKGLCLLIAYVDDLGLAGPRREAMPEYAALDQRVGFGKKSKSNPELSLYAGICYEVLGVLQNGALLYRIHQCEYCNMLVEKYKKRKGLPVLKPVLAPMTENIEFFDGHALAGVDAPYAREWVGGLLFLVRGTRPDCYVAVIYLGRKVTKWSRMQDRQLLRLMQYLDGTTMMSLESYAHHADLKSIALLSEWDADHVGSEDTTKSTSGYITEAVGASFPSTMSVEAVSEKLVTLRPTTRALIDWAAKLQGATERGTPGAELVAGADCLTRSSWPLQGTMEQVYLREIPLILGTDNSTALLDLNIGWSKGMKHLRKHQKVSIGLLSEGLDREDTWLLKKPSAENRSDILTKPLPPATHWKHVRGLGLTMSDPASRVTKARL